jgi:hypothetical protein
MAEIDRTTIDLKNPKLPVVVQTRPIEIKTVDVKAVDVKTVAIPPIEAASAEVRSADTGVLGAEPLKSPGTGRSGSLIALSTCGVVVIGAGVGLVVLTGTERFGSLLGRFFGFFFGFGH